MIHKLVSEAREHPGLLLVIDSLRRAVPGDEIDSRTPDRFFREVFVPLRDAGATVVLLAHPPKPPSMGETRPENLIRGSGDWLAILDSFIVLKTAPSMRRRLARDAEEIDHRLSHIKARAGPKAPPAP